MDIRW